MKKQANSRWQRASRRPTAGFTLVEVMISGVIMAFVLVSTIAVISHSANYVDDLRMRVRSSQVLQQSIEELRVMNWSNVVAASYVQHSHVLESNKTFSSSITIDPYQSIGSTTIVVRASVMVTWTNRHERVVTNRLETLIGKDGMNKAAL
jgi:Tfp pilus assembly protein PilV